MSPSSKQMASLNGERLSVIIIYRLGVEHFMHSAVVSYSQSYSINCIHGQDIVIFLDTM